VKLAIDHAIAQIGKRLGDLFTDGDYEKFGRLCIGFQILTNFIAQDMPLVDVSLGFAANVDAVQR
jgi:hypothetical protein